MKTFTDQQLRDMDLATAKNEIMIAFYEAGDLIERLENWGKVCGNGHHIRRRLADNAANELQARWIK